MNEYLLEQAILADLKWLLNTPPLLAPSPFLWPVECLKTDQNYQFTDHELSTLKQARNGKLGLYFEALAGYLFSSHPNYEVLAQNKVITQNKRTLGELDLLLLDLKTKQVIHLELALKFYLWVPNRLDAATSWVGAGLKDFMDRKVKRLFHHQLRLPDIALELGCWPDDLPQPTQHFLWMPGRLYLPGSQHPRDIPLTHFEQTPWRLNPLAEVSSWYENDRDIHALPTRLHKSDWLVGNPLTFNDRPLPAQFTAEDHLLPLYVLPSQWQTNAELAIEQYEANYD